MTNHLQTDWFHLDRVGRVKHGIEICACLHSTISEAQTNMEQADYKCTDSTEYHEVWIEIAQPVCMVRAYAQFLHSDNLMCSRHTVAASNTIF